MDSILINWFLLVGIFGIALASPGPDFVIAARYALIHSRKVGVMTALGFAVGVIVHVTYVLLGLATLIAQSVILFNIIKYIGAAYLFYIGVQALLSKGTDPQKAKQSAPDMDKTKTITYKKAFMTGFLTNLLNPKATMFFLAIFSQFISVETTALVQTLYAGTCVAMTFLWFSFVAVVLSSPKIKESFFKFSKWIDKVCGILLIGLSIKLVLTTNP